MKTMADVLRERGREDVRKEAETAIRQAEEMAEKQALEARKQALEAEKQAQKAKAQVNRMVTGFLAMGVDMATILKVTGMSREDIAVLKAKGSEG